MAFGKPGRPAEDRLARQREIYQAVSPLILETGVHYLSMRAAAQAAYLSIGGLYHHFQSKRELVLHGIQPETISRMCQEFHDEFGYLADSDPASFLNAYLDFLSRSIGFVRPAFHAAIELGLEPLESAMEPMLAAANKEFMTRFCALLPEASEEDVDQAGRAVHRTLVAALIDKNVTLDELRKQITVLVNGYTILRQPTSTTAASLSYK